MKLGKKSLLCGFVLAACAFAVGSQGLTAAAAQDKQQDKQQGKQPPGKGKKAAPSFKGESFLSAFRDSVATAAKSTVRVKCDGKDTALGVVVTADGFILTKASDLVGKITVLLGSGEEMEAQWIGHHEPNDLAVLRIIASNLIPAVFTESKVAPVGNFVASPAMGADPVAVGVVSVLARDVPPPKKGPAKGEGKGEAKGEGKGFPAPNSLGVLTADDPKGAKITGFPKGFGGGGKGGKGGGGKGGDPAPASDKLKVDDIILAIGDKSIKDTETLNKVLQSYKAGQEITLKLLRGEETLDLKMNLSKQAPSRADNQNNMGSELSKRRTGFPTIIQHDSVVKPQDCGGPLVDLDGHVIGINIARWGRVESYAVPSEVILGVLPELMSGRMPPQKKK